MSNNLLQNTIENTQEIIQKQNMSAYTVNTSAFQAVMEREFNAYLKNMKNLGLLTVSVKACKEAIATGTVVEKTKKASGRPKKAPARKVSDGDIIEGMVAKADAKPKKARKPKMTEEEKAAKKLLKKEEKAKAKAAKKLLKDEAKAAKALALAQTKAEKAAAAKVLKEQEKLAKEQAKAEAKVAAAKLKEEAKAAKKLAADQAKAEKAALKEKIKAEKVEAKRLEKEAKELEKQKLKAEKLAAKQQEKVAKKAAAAELRAKKNADKKAAKKVEDERKKKEALALMQAAIQEDIPITNDEGEVIGSKVEGFNMPEEKQPEGELEEDEMNDENFEAFTHDSRPNQSLLIDPTSQNVFKVSEDGEYEHIGQLNSDGELLECCESDDEEEAFPEME
tara:strand:+ start:1786 stop:2961 length:1176 start_codon:yes stop_codon:yes gene_type:complete